MFDYIVDSHCHLDLLAQKGLDIDEVVNRANIDNVKLLQTICTKISDINAILYYANKYQNIFASAGVHPCNVDSEKLYLAAEIIKIIDDNPKIVGIGETGLDYYHDKSFVEKQKESFLQHIKASQISRLPIIIHSRDADDDMIDILTNEQKESAFPALLHCFSSGKDLAMKALDLGVYISIAGIVTFKNAKELQEIVKLIPLEYLLVETDSPYLAPTPNRGKINEPSFTKHVVDFIADLKNVSRETIIEKTTSNFHKIFTRAKILGNEE